MSIALARQFIQRVLKDEAFVMALNEVPSYADVQGLLSQEGFVFDSSHFDDAYRNLLTQCQHPGQAEFLQEIKMWWDFLEGHFSQVAGPS